MKERLANVVAWGVWLWAIGFAVFAAGAAITGNMCGARGCTDHPFLIFLLMAGMSLGPVAAQWLLFYVLLGSPRFLPWQRPEQAEDGTQ